MPRFTRHHCVTVPDWLDRILQDRDPKIPYSLAACVAFAELVKDDFGKTELERFFELRRRLRASTPKRR